MFEPNGTFGAFCTFLRGFAAHNSKSSEIIELLRVQVYKFEGPNAMLVLHVIVGRRSFAGIILNKSILSPGLVFSMCKV